MSSSIGICICEIENGRTGCDTATFRTKSGVLASVHSWLFLVTDERITAALLVTGSGPDAPPRRRLLNR
jgi:hypothetical protein